MKKRYKVSPCRAALMDELEFTINVFTDDRICRNDFLKNLYLKKIHTIKEEIRKTKRIAGQ